jgi:hypothetical protein
MEKLYLSGLIAIFVLVSVSCERTADDLDRWRNAKSGVDKFIKWTGDAKQPKPVRQRSFELLVIDEHYAAISKALDKVESQQRRQKLVTSVMPRLKKMWEKQDFPSSEEIADAKESGSRVKVGESDAVQAKDTAYHLLPYAGPSDKSFLRDLLADWMSKDWEIRNQLGRLTFQDLITRIDANAAGHLAEWMKTTKQPVYVTKLANQFGEPSIQDAVAKNLAARLTEMHPDVDESFRTAMLMTESSEIAEYLRKAIMSAKSGPKLVSDAIDTLTRIQKEKAVPFFQDVIDQTKGKLRWIATQRIIELRGKAGFLIAAKALPEDTEAYDDKQGAQLQDNAEFFCNFYKTELEKEGVVSAELQLEKGLDHDKWPVRLLASLCLRKLEIEGLEKELKDLTDDRTDIPGWEDYDTVGEVAERTEEVLGS